MEKVKKILLCYAALLAASAIYFDFLTKHKPPHWELINFGLSVINFIAIGYLLYHWDKVRRYNLEIEQADESQVNISNSNSTGVVA